LLSQAIGVPGSYLGYQIVFGLLVWARAVLLFLIIFRTLPGSLWLAFTVGAIELFHAADGLTNWLGQINQHNYIFWLYLSFYCMVEAFRGRRAAVKIILSVAAAVALYLCMWSYEAAVALACIGPIIILVGGKLADRQRITWLDGLCLLIPWSVLAWYTFESVERYIVVGAQSTYQYGHLRKVFSVTQITKDLIFNLYHSLAFWTWLPQRLSGPAIGNGLLAAGAWLIAVLFAKRSRADMSVPPPRMLVALLFSGFFGLVAALSVFMVLDVSRSLMRTQFLSAGAASLVWASLLWLVAHPLRRYQLLSRLAPAVTVALVIFFGATAAYQYGNFHKEQWDRFQAAYSALLRAVPDLLPDTILVMIASPERAPASEDLWFDAGLRLAYPQVQVKGTFWYANQEPIIGQDLMLTDGSWVWQRTGFFLSAEPIPFKNTVIVELNETAEVSVLEEVPSFISEDAQVRQAYRPHSRILCGSPSQTALNRYEMSSLPLAKDCVKPAQTINIARASFGLNCAQKSWPTHLLNIIVTLGNETKRIQRLCHGLSRCEFDVSGYSFDNPRPTCGDKELKISWRCGESAYVHSTRVPNALGKRVELSCDAN
jgi:hypothetical protein